MAEVHKHLIIRAETNKTPTDPAWAHQWLTKLVKKIGMKICQGPITAYVNVPGNKGLTGLVVIETSHIVLHIWDEQNPGLFQLDVYSCKTFDLDIVISCLKESFDVKKLQYKFLDRTSDLLLIDEI